MSWARFGSRCGHGCASCPGSDVYVFDNSDGYVECCGCQLLGPMGAHWVQTEAKMYEHLADHQAIGHHVPWSLRKEMSAEEVERRQRDVAERARARRERIREAWAALPVDTTFFEKYRGGLK